MWKEALHVLPGITAVIGGGGKTTLLKRLADELRSDGHTVILTTSTHILPFDGMQCLDGADEAATLAAIKRDGIVCLGTPCERGKLTAPRTDLLKLTSMAEYVLVEADGSKGLPLKVHGPQEPVIPDGTREVIEVVGAQAAGKTARESVHRLDPFFAICGAEADDLITPDMAARVIHTEKLADIVFINHAETFEEQKFARELQSLLKVPCIAGSLFQEVILC